MEYQEIEDLRLLHKTTYPQLLKMGLINKEDLKTAVKGMSLKIKEQYEKDGFKTDFFATHNIINGSYKGK